MKLKYVMNMVVTSIIFLPHLIGLYLTEHHIKRKKRFGYMDSTHNCNEKTFKWIYENYIEKNCNKYNFKNVVIFKNKLIVDINGGLNMVLCKNVSDCIRLYNQLEGLLQ